MLRIFIDGTISEVIKFVTHLTDSLSLYLHHRKPYVAMICAVLLPRYDPHVKYHELNTRHNGSREHSYLINVSNLCGILINLIGHDIFRNIVNRAIRFP